MREIGRSCTLTYTFSKYAKGIESLISSLQPIRLFFKPLVPFLYYLMASLPPVSFPLPSLPAAFITLHPVLKGGKDPCNYSVCRNCAMKPPVLP